MPEEQVEQKQEVNQQEQVASNLQKLLSNFEGAPSQEQIDAWKKQYREVFVSGFSDSEVYLWRPINRPEYLKVQQQVQDPGSPIDQYKLEEKVCETCVLWKSVDVPWAEGKAGTPNALSEQILQNSNFLSPQAASMLVVKL